MTTAKRNAAKKDLRKLLGTLGPFPEKDFAFCEMGKPFSKTVPAGSLRCGSENTQGRFLKNEHEWLTA